MVGENRANLGNKLLACKDKRIHNMLIVVTSQLDAAVTSLNVLNPMENHCYGIFECML